MQRNAMTLWLIPACLVLSGCQQEPAVQVADSASVRPADDTLAKNAEIASVDELTAEQQEQHATALAAREALFTKLSGRLMSAIEKDGAAAAINVCKAEAPAIAEQVKREFGVDIGRTSFRLRNSMNPPPDWSSRFVAERAESPQFAALPDNALGVLLPIKLQQNCLLCHGPQEQLADDVKAALALHYPNDEATGFLEGDLRGWFWIEVPAVLNAQQDDSNSRR